jgi:hypothetical protein
VERIVSDVCDIKQGYTQFGGEPIAIFVLKHLDPTLNLSFSRPPLLVPPFC